MRLRSMRAIRRVTEHSELPSPSWPAIPTYYSHRSPSLAGSVLDKPLFGHVRRTATAADHNNDKNSNAKGTTGNQCAPQSAQDLSVSDPIHLSSLSLRRLPSGTRPPLQGRTNAPVIELPPTQRSLQDYRTGRKNRNASAQTVRPMQ